MKLKRDDYFLTIFIIALLVWYFFVKEITLLIVAIALIPGFYIGRTNLSYKRKWELGLIPVVIWAFIYGIHKNDLLIMLKITVATIMIGYGLFEFGATFVSTLITGEKEKDYNKRLLIAIILTVFGITFYSYFIYSVKEEFEKRRMREKVEEKWRATYSKCVKAH